MKETGLAEGIFDKETTELSRIFLNHIKQFGNEKPESKEFTYGEHGETTVSFTFEDDFEGGEPEIADGTFNANEQSVSVVTSWPVEMNGDVRLHYQKLQGELKNALRHELEHLRQIVRGSRDSSWKTDWKQHKATKAVNPTHPDVTEMVFYDPVATKKYLLNPLEVEAFVMGGYKEAKSKKLPLSQVLKSNLDQLLSSMELGGISSKDRFMIGAEVWNAWKSYVKDRLPRAIMERKNASNTMSKNLKDFLPFWEAADKSWQDGEPEASHAHQPEKGDAKEKPYKKPKVHITSKETPSEMNTLEKPHTFVPGKDKDANTMQLDQGQDLLHKLEEELAALAEPPKEVEEGLVTPDLGTSVLGRSLFSGAALQPANGYGRNFDPDELAPEEIPPGYQQNYDKALPAPEEGSGFQHQDVAGTIIAPKKWVPREGVQRRLAEHLERQRLIKLGKF
jgi:hypothetical protein